MNQEVQRTFNRKGARAGAQSSPPCSFNSLMWPQANPGFHHLKITKELSRQGGAPQRERAGAVHFLVFGDQVRPVTVLQEAGTSIGAVELPPGAWSAVTESDGGEGIRGVAPTRQYE